MGRIYPLYGDVDDDDDDNNNNSYYPNCSATIHYSFLSPFHQLVHGQRDEME